MNRRSVLILPAMAISAFFMMFTSILTPQPALARGDVDMDAVLHDPAAPVGGNPQGDVTIVAYLDYNCPFCKKTTPVLDNFIKSDGHIRLVYKDWPILTEASVYGAQMALAAGYQGRYEQVHGALMGITGRRGTQDVMLETIKASGVDMTRLSADLAAHAADISSLLARNNLEAQAMGFEGTPAFLIGPYQLSGAVDADTFRQVVAKVRAGKAGQAN